MKFNFKKVSAVLTSAVMIASSAGFAAAASFPSGYTSSPAVVYGAAGAASDMNAANSIATYLQGQGASAGNTNVLGGESVAIQRGTSTFFNIGEGISDVITTAVTKDSPGEGLPTLLADGTYTDANNDEFKYTQKIDLANLTWSMFDDNDYKEDSPTLGIKIDRADYILNYTLDFTTYPIWDDLVTSTIPVMGKEYYVSSITNGSVLSLLDAANSAVLQQGETKTITAGGKTYDVSASIITGTGSSGRVKLLVNGESTNTLSQGQTQKLSDGSYVGVKDILSQEYAGGVQQVEVSVGSGKLELIHGSDIKINDESVTDLRTYFTSSGGQLQKIVIEWKADDKMFVTDDSEAVIPGFESIKLTSTGMNFPAEESIKVAGGSDSYIVLKDFPLKDSVEDIPILYGNNSNFQQVGKDANRILRTSNNGSILFDADTDEQFPVSWTDGRASESYLMRATSFSTENSGTVNYTTIQYRKDGSWVDLKTKAKEADVVSIGNTEITVGVVNRDLKTVVLSVGSSANFRSLYTKEGMKVFLPYLQNDTTATGALSTEFMNGTTFSLVFSEEDSTENVGAGKNITLTLGWNSATTKEAYVSDVVGGSVSFSEIGSSKVWRSFVYSDLGTEIQWDKSGDQYSVELIYHGDVAYANVYLAESGASSSAGSMVFKDSEKSSWQTKNVILVGGTCINSATAEALGTTIGTCEEAFKTLTTVGDGQYLIQVVGDAFTSGKTAIVVAGYNAADTTAAASYLVANPSKIDVTSGNKYIGLVGATGSSTISGPL